MNTFFLFFFTPIVVWPTDPNRQTSKMEFETVGDNDEINKPGNSFLLTASGVATAFNNNLHDNNVTNWTWVKEDYLKNSPAAQVIIYILYVAIFVVGLLGNALVVFVVAQNRAMKTVTNCFIANLALSDILLCVLAVPFTPLYFFLKEWIFGEILCHLVAYSQVIAFALGLLPIFYSLLCNLGDRVRRCTYRR